MKVVRKNARSVILTAMALIVGGCEVGPNYRAPVTKMPASYAQTRPVAATRPAEMAISIVDQNQEPWVDWWTKFDDPELNSLVSRATAANNELKIAAARVQEARADQRAAESYLYPKLDIAAGIAWTRGSAAGYGFPYGLPGLDTHLFQIGFDAVYEVDIFGGVHRGIEAATASAEATENQRRAVQVTLLGEVARDYIELRALQRRLDVARANLDDQRKTLDIVQRRFDNGLTTHFDVVRAAALVAGTESVIPPLESGIRQTIHEISILLDEEPEALSDELTAAAPIPPVPPRVPVGLPSELLQRRPDIMGAERILAAATAEEGVAVSGLFPHMILGGTAGVDSRTADHLFSEHDPNSGFYTAGPLVDWTIFDGGLRQAKVDRSKAQVAEAAVAYQETVLEALRDVDNKLVAYSQDQAQRNTLARLGSEDEEAVRIAKSRYSHGLVTLLDVLVVEQNLFAAQDQLAQSDEAVSIDLVALYKSLGGGWQTDAAVDGAKAR